LKTIITSMRAGSNRYILTAVVKRT